MAALASTGAFVAFDVLYAVGLFSLGAIFVTSSVSSRVRRQVTWYMVIVSWVLNSASNLLLVGKQTHPLSSLNSGLCLTQAVLIDSTPVLCAFCASGFAVEVYATIMYALYSNSSVLPRHYTVTMVAIPWLVFAGTVAITTSNGLMHRSVIEKYPSGFFCWNAVPNDWRKYLIGGAVVIGILGAIITEALILVKIRQRWNAIAESASIRREKPYITIDSIVRMIVFSAGIVVALGLTFLQYLTTPTLDEDTALGIVQASLPCFAALVFGSQKDIMDVWIILIKGRFGGNWESFEPVVMEPMVTLNESGERLRIQNDTSIVRDSVDTQEERTA